MNWTKRLADAAIISVILATGCSTENPPVKLEIPTSEPPVAAIPTTPKAITFETSAITQSTTQNDLSGNHITNGSMDIRSALVLDIPLEEKPIWLVSAPLNDSAVFVAIMEDGTAEAFEVTRQTYSPIEITPAQLPIGMPPLLAVLNGKPKLVVPPADASPLTNPILLGDGLVYVASNGDLVVNEARLPINALPDSRILIDENDRLLILSQPTERYDHSVLGDELEASAITLVETQPETRIIHNIPITEPDVIEGVSAIWTDMDSDGNREIIVTLSNNQTGARVVVFNEDGRLFAASDPIGLGYRWRHQLAVAQFEANKPLLLVSVRTPHIGGIVEFFQYKGDSRLEIVKEFKGFSTHSIGSRNLDSAIAVDLNDDGIIELLVPDQPHTSLGILSLNEVISSLPLDGMLTSNISAVNVDGILYIAAGTQGKLRVWIP